MLEVPGEQFVEAVFWMPPCDSLQGFLDVGEWLDLVDLRGLDERSDDTPGFAALVVASKEILPPISRCLGDQVSV